MKEDNKKKSLLVHEQAELRSQKARGIPAEVAPEETLSFAKSIVETVRDPFLVLDADLKVIWANRNFYRTFKTIPSETLGSFIYDLGNRQWDIPALRGLFETILPKHKIIDNFEVDHVFLDIGSKTMLLNARRIYRRNNEAETILLAIEDITKRKQMENSLKLSEERYRRVFETADDGILLLEKFDGRIAHANPAITRILGYTQKKITGKTIQSLGVLSNMTNFQTTMQTLSEKDILNYKNVQIKTMSGHYIETDIYFVDRAKLVQCNIRDITQRKQSEYALQQSEKRYRLLFEKAEDGIALADADTGEIVDCNQALRGMVERDETELLGQHQRILHPPQHLKNGDSFSFRLHKIGDPGQALEDNLLSKSGKIIPVEIRASKIRLSERDYILGIFRDITERKQAEETLQHTLESLRNAVNATIQVVVSTVEARDPYTANHQLRVAILARAIATEVKLPQNMIEGIYIVSSIHDLGKLCVPAEILSKPGKLTETEFTLIKEHSQTGYDILKNVESSWPLAEIVYQHHERMDGSGYPRNLKGDEILMEARILAVCDVVEAMASHRPYRAALGIDAALKEIEDNRGTLYDADVVDVCLRLFREKGFTLGKT